ncbi:hypothetical protein F5X99DRAFT_221142 [Biscogniauxia marginata]|nr:hypothetical protein F5X99DRAFT_221142 [Biscogniauxia marginata]
MPPGARRFAFFHLLLVHYIISSCTTVLGRKTRFACRSFFPLLSLKFFFLDTSQKATYIEEWSLVLVCILRRVQEG